MNSGDELLVGAPAREGAIRPKPTIVACLQTISIVAALFLVIGCEIAEIDKMAEVSPLRKILFKAAVTSNRKHDYAAAVATYQTLYANDSDDIEAALGLARNLRYAGSFDQATAVLERSLVRHPDNIDVFTEQGKLHLVRSDPEAAIAALDRAKELGSTNWQTYSTLGIAYDLLARFELARASYDEALAISPKNSAILNNLALSWALTGDLDRAIAILKGLVAAVGTGVQERQNLALLHALKGEYGMAQGLVRRDLGEEVADNNLKYYRWLGTALDLPADGPAPDRSADGPALDLPADGLALDLPADGPALDLPADGPALDLPADGPAPDRSADGLALALPADGPAPDRPADGPALALPADGPALALPADGPAPDRSADGPALALPADGPAPDLPANGLAHDLPADGLNVVLARTSQATPPNVQYVTQLVAYRHAAPADRAWDMLMRKFPDILNGMNHRVRKIDLGAKKGIFYGLQAGSFASRAAAHDVCDQLIVLNQDCMVVRR